MDGTLEVERMENDLKEIIKENQSKIKDLEKELSGALEDKTDYEQICQNLTTKC